MWKGLSSSVLSVPRVIHACTILLGIFISATRLLKRVTHGNWPRALWFIYLLLLTFPSTNVINSCLDGKDKQTQLSQKICSFACLYIVRRFTISWLLLNSCGIEGARWKWFCCRYVCSFFGKIASRMGYLIMFSKYLRL